MQSGFTVALYMIVFLGVIFLADAILGIVRAARGYDDDAVDRRLKSPLLRAEGEEAVNVVRRQDGAFGHIPLEAKFRQLAEQSGTNTPPARLWLRVAMFSIILFIPLALLFPARFFFLSMLAAPVGGIAIVLLHLWHLAKKRMAKFTEQLPDAIDLMVRSLRVGHPVAGAMAVIAREMEAPLAPEFAIAVEEVRYGHDVPTAFARMTERMPVPDLGYLTVVVQVQQEAGGNLVESLSKLSEIMRDRFRMFRKVKSLTVEGRVSSWILSLFPLFIIAMLMFIKPDYFDQAMKLAYFPAIAAVLVTMLVVNVLVMRAITNIKV